MSTLQHHRGNKCPGVHQVTAKIAPLHARKQKHKCLAQFNSQNEIKLKMYNSHVFKDYLDSQEVIFECWNALKERIADTDTDRLHYSSIQGYSAVIYINKIT